MKAIQKKILLAFIFFPIAFLIGYLLENALISFGNVDEYGVPENEFFGRIYLFFHQKDGLYDMPNLTFYLFVITINLLLYKYIFNRFLKDKN